MKTKEFEMFRLVGGTALSLYRGHRQSVDIDLFTDAEYNSIDFRSIDSFLKENYPYVDSNKTNIIGMGKSFYIGENKNNCIKLDVYYTDKFIHPINLIDNIRLASIEDIIAMKIDVVSRIGRKKDFWDIHDLSHNYSLEEMLLLHEKRYPYNHDRNLIKSNFSNFSIADEDFNPICLKNKLWGIIKLDLMDFVNQTK
jgi:predicted nucleotidyltransferase component of viral defense system